MKNAILLIWLIILLPIKNLSAQTKAEILVKELETKRFAALVNKNFDFLYNVLSENLEYFHSSGNIDTKTIFMQNQREGKLSYEEIMVQKIDTKQYAKNVVINRGRIKLSVKAANNDGKPFSLYFTDVYVKEKGGWKMVSWQSTRLPN